MQLQKFLTIPSLITLNAPWTTGYVSFLYFVVELIFNHYFKYVFYCSLKINNYCKVGEIIVFHFTRHSLDCIDWSCRKRWMYADSLSLTLLLPCLNRKILRTPSKSTYMRGCAEKMNEKHFSEKGVYVFSIFVAEKVKYVC